MSTFLSNNSKDNLSSESLKKASQLIFDIEDIIKHELEDLERFITSDNDVPFQRVINKAKRKFEKRRGPLLIKPLNKKKSRIVLSDMEYDPVKQIWKGNEKELNIFPSTPGLITPINLVNSRIGNMTWDENHKEWRGNEGDLSKFKQPNKPGLITQLNPQLMMKTENGMVYDPVTMKWTGNEDDLGAFDAMDEQNKDSAFTVGKEFNLTSTLLQIFKQSETNHQEELAGWFPEERKLEDKDYLYLIRNMSIMKLVQTAIYGTPGGNLNKQTGSLPPPSSPGGLIPLLTANSKPKVIDETKSWEGDVDFDDDKPIKLSLKVHQDSQGDFGSGDNMSTTSGGANDLDDVSDWDKEMGFTSEDDTTGNSNVNTPRLKLDEWNEPGGFNDSFGNNTTGNNTSLSVGKIIQLNKFKEKSQESEEDQDDDDIDWDSFNGNSNSNNQSNNNNNNQSNLNSIKPSTSSGSIGVINNLGKGTIKAIEKGGSLKIRNNVNNIPSLASIFNNPNNNSNNNNNNNSTPLSSSGSHKFGGGPSSIKSGGKKSVSDISDMSDNESFLDDFEVPKGSLSLELHMKDLKIHKDSFSDLMMSQGDEAETIKFFNDDKEVVAEDWPEVQFPSKFGTFKASELRKSPPTNRNQIDDYSEDLEFQTTNQPLQLKKPSILIDNPFGDDDDWSNDINFPVNFRPSTPSQKDRDLNNSTPNSNNNNNNSNGTPNAYYNNSNSTIKSTSLYNINNNDSIYSTPNNNKTTTTTTTTTTTSTLKKQQNLNLLPPSSPSDDFRPLSPNSRNQILSTPPDSSPKTPFKYINRSKTDPIKLGSDTF